MKKFLGLITKNEWTGFRYLVTLAKGVEVEYTLGLGHCTLLTDGYNPEKILKAAKTDSVEVPRKELSLEIASQLVRGKPRNFSYEDFKSFRIFSKKPKYRDVIYSLAQDAQCAQDSFEDFCSNLGYDTDSRSALETYLACQESGHKLRKLGYSLDRILAWEL